nr:MAG TPA: hypothetical protein [Caudoviricetes sp.]
MLVGADKKSIRMNVSTEYDHRTLFCYGDTRIVKERSVL